LVDGVIVMPISQVLMFTVIGLMVGQYIEVTQSTQNNNLVKIGFRFTPIIALIGLVSLLLSTMPEMIRGLTSADRVLQPGERAFSITPNTITPRIWMQQRHQD
ncbi:MAG TPA: hypothetical protein VK946_00460, partial [Methylotenera sp.]|nr:hypothetical protein [Methylotenera sp.]